MRGASSAAILAAAAITGAAPAVSGERKPVVLVRDGRPAASIVLARQAARAAQLGAYEVQHHVSLIIGASLPIVTEEQPVTGTRILIGESEATRALGLKASDLKAQEYLIRLLPDAAVLLGRDQAETGQVACSAEDPASIEGRPGFWEEQGTLHAAYDFLERFCGVRWLNPTEVGTSCPRARDLAVGGEDVGRAPAFEFRDAIGATGDNPARYDAYVALWPENTPEFRARDAEAYAGLHRRYPDAGRYQGARAPGGAST